MELVLDYTASTDPLGADSEAEVRRLEELTACFQQYVGHELVNQLVPLQAFAQLLQHGEGVAEEGRLLLRRLADLTQRTDRRARQLAEVGRLLREPARNGSIRPGDVLLEAATEVKTRGRASEVAFVLPTVSFSVTQSRALLYAVVVQLLTNALQAIPPGRPGTIRVEADRRPPGWELRVRDDGRGMDEAQRALLLEPFAASRAAGASGPGLGFFLIRQATARWQGRVTVTSRSGQGTTVALWLPDRPSPAAPAHGRSHP